MATTALATTAVSGGLTVVAYSGDNMVLLAFSLAPAALSQNGGLAGFAVTRTTAGGQATPLSNRLTFAGVPKSGTPITSIDSPFQKFRWLDVPPDGFSDTITYRVTARYFAKPGANNLMDGPSVTLAVEPIDRTGWRFRVNFTRGYLASQAYANKFKNAPIRPAGAKSIDFETAPFEAQWAWLGGDARKALHDFIEECLADAGAKVDVFAYDLDEPYVIASICQLGKSGRLRAVLDNASLHTKKGAAEIAAKKAIVAAAGADNVVSGHFNRFSHDKIFIKRGADGKGQKVLTGSANFSIRGLYVQANSVVVIDDPAVAQTYAAVFDAAFAGGAKFAAFAKAQVSEQWFETAPSAGMPKFSVSFAPHSDPTLSLGPVAASIQHAHSSVLFAVMDVTSGGGPVLQDLRDIAATPSIFSYGTVQTAKGLQLQKPDGALSQVAGFAALKKEVPEPFTAEWDGGMGQTIHHKFVVVDFNGDNPVVYCGSSNLAQGGEGANGDNLLAISDPAIAVMYAVEAVRLFDHYHFRTAVAEAGTATPLALQGQGAASPWWRAYYDPTDIKLRDRCLFAKVPLPAGVATVKAAAAPDTAPPPKARKSAGKAKSAAAAAKRKKGSAPKRKAKAPAKRTSAKKRATPKRKQKQKRGTAKRKRQ
jgi:PLD-like domain